MDIQALTDYFHRYGAIVVFIIVFLEYLNMPGFPSGVIMPLAGIWAAKGNIGFITVLILSVIAGICGSWVLYLVGRYGGELVLHQYVKKFPKQKPIIEKTIERIRMKGYLGIFVGKLIPVLRTIISIPAGVLKVNFIGYTIASTFGILIWNLVLVGAGYLFGETALRILA